LIPESLDKRVRRDGELVAATAAVYAPDEPLPPGDVPEGACDAAF
jgi:hypothetical protein